MKVSCFVLVFIFYFVYECCLHVCPSLVCLVPTEIRSIASLGTGVTDGFALPCGCRESNPGHLKEQQMLLTTELSPQLLFFKYNIVCVVVPDNVIGGYSLLSEVFLFPS